MSNDATEKAISRITTPAGLTDSHCHLEHMAARGIDVPRYLDVLEELGFAYILDIGVEANDLARRESLITGRDKLYLAASVHAVEAHTVSPEEAAEYLDRACTRPKVVAVGEIGLDYFRADASREHQRAVFGAQLQKAAERRLPVIIHNREADNDVLSALEGFSEPVLFHCFSSTAEVAAQALSRGYYLSFAGNVTFKKNTALQGVLRDTPGRQLFLETDAPYLTPEPLRGRTNAPGLIGHTYDKAASIRGVTIEEMAKTVRENFQRVFLRPNP